MANTQKILVPDIGDFADVDVVEVMVSPGSRVEKEDSLITLESDKASLDVPSPASGQVVEVLISVGDKVSEGSPICTMEIAGEDGSEPDSKEEKAPPADEPPVKSPAPEAAPEKATAPTPPAPPMPAPGDGTKPHATPSVRKFARELGADLSRVTPSGPKGRITKADVEAFIRRSLESGATGGAALLRPAPIDFTKFGPVEEVPLTRIQSLSARGLTTSWLNAPMVTQFDEADITELEAFRKENAAIGKEEGFKFSVLPFLVKACAAALAEFPRFNSSLSDDGERLIMKKYFNIGVAVDTPNGLVVPVLRNADGMGLTEIARELGVLSERAREGKSKLDDFQGAGFTISSLGGIGGTAFTPIVNVPEVAILGVSRARIKPIWDGEKFEPRLMLPLSLTYDHRVIDGAAAARFTTYLSGLLADTRKMLL